MFVLLLQFVFVCWQSWVKSLSLKLHVKTQNLTLVKYIFAIIVQWGV
jgi:hypothetical protein